MRLRWHISMWRLSSYPTKLKSRQWGRRMLWLSWPIETITHTAHTCNSMIIWFVRSYYNVVWNDWLVWHELVWQSTLHVIVRLVANEIRLKQRNEIYDIFIGKLFKTCSFVCSYWRLNINHVQLEIVIIIIADMKGANSVRFIVDSIRCNCLVNWTPSRRMSNMCVCVAAKRSFNAIAPASAMHCAQYILL